MPKISEACLYVRSKNAGPFWITLDLTFPDKDSFDRFSKAEALQPPAISALFDVDVEQVKFFLVPELCVVKISYPRKHPQGGAIERDMHGGQQYVQLLDIELHEAAQA